jgi:hypothetical protein
MEINTAKPKTMAFRETKPIRRNPLMTVWDMFFSLCTLQLLIYIHKIVSHPGNYFLSKCITAYLYTLRFGLTARQTWIISNPIFSPSLSQSVQIMSDPHCRTSFSNVRCKQRKNVTRPTLIDIIVHFLLHTVIRGFRYWYSTENVLL